MGYDEFLKKIKESVSKFNSLDKSPVKIIGDLDADGISGTSILIKALKRKDIGFSVSFVINLDKKLLEELVHEDYKTIFFIDKGSERLYDIEKILADRNIFIFDHHGFDSKPKKAEHLNPRAFDLEYNEVSSAGISYLFCRELSEENKDLAYLGISGAIGDMQNGNGFIGINKEILDDAIKSGEIEVETGLTLFRFGLGPLHKSLEYSVVPFIPGVTGSEKGSLEFLKENGIKVKKGEEFRKLTDLSEEEMKKLVTGIALKRLGSDDAEGVVGTIYRLRKENDLKDLREFTSLLDACGKLNKPSFGVGFCLGDGEVRKEALKLFEDYRKEVINALNWFYKNKDKFEKEGFVVINAENNMRHSITGIIAGIISNSNFYDDGEIIIVMARTPTDETKISLIVSGDDTEIDLRKVLKDIIGKLGDYNVGGHKHRCGATIPKDKEEAFLGYLSKYLPKVVVH